MEGSTKSDIILAKHKPYRAIRKIALSLKEVKLSSSDSAKLKQSYLAAGTINSGDVCGACGPGRIGQDAIAFGL